MSSGPITSPAKLTIEGIGPEHVTKQHLAVSRLRRAIIDGELPSNSWLRQVELSTIAGVSRTPIREALMQLATEGLVVIHPHKGVIVVPLSADEFEDLYLVREAMEPLAARLSAERMDGDGIAGMEDLLAQLRTAVDDVHAYLSTEGQMRALQYAACGSPNLTRVVESFRERASRYLHLFASIPGHTRDKLRLDEAIVAAYRQHDGTTAGRLTREALRATVEALRPFLTTTDAIPQAGGAPAP